MRHRPVTMLLPMLLLALLAQPAIAPAIVAGTDVLYTSDADFDTGSLVDVNHDAPNNDQLQLSRTTTFFPFVNIAASDRGTVVRINVDTGAVVGEYSTAPQGRAKSPSRTTVDKLGNVWVTNRGEAAGGQGSIARIGVISGGTRSQADGTPNPAGEYLKGPFAYNTCQDRDIDGLIKTSMGLADIRPWTNLGGVDDNGGVDTAEDECLINYTRIAGTNARTVAVDANNDVWVGGFGNAVHEKLDGVTGQPIMGTQFNFGCGGYGGLIDQKGILWSARSGGLLLRYDPATNTGACLAGIGDYGLGLDPTTNEVWQTSLSGGANGQVHEIDHFGNLLNSFGHGNQFAQGVAVDKVGNVWVAHSLFGATTVGHLRTDGTYVGNVTLPGGNGPTGVAVDANGKVWVANLNSNNAMRIDPNAGPVGGGGFPIGLVDLVVDLGPGAGPYNYSDMTGSVLGEITAPVGTWTTVQDGGAAGTQWGTVTWNTEPQASVPAGTSIEVVARAADTAADLALEPFTAVSNGTDFSLTGQYIEVQASLFANGAGESPVLSDIRIATANDPPDCESATAGAPEMWPPNHRMVSVTVDGVTDPDGDALTVTITSIRQDEPVLGAGSGNTTPDGTGVGSSTASVRVERSGQLNGRVYHVAFDADDGNGGTCSGVVNVSVPHDRRGTPATDEGPLFDSTTS